MKLITTIVLFIASLIQSSVSIGSFDGIDSSFPNSQENANQKLPWWRKSRSLLPHPPTIAHSIVSSARSIFYSQRNPILNAADANRFNDQEYLVLELCLLSLQNEREPISSEKIQELIELSGEETFLDSFFTKTCEGIHKKYKHDTPFDLALKRKHVALLYVITEQLQLESSTDYTNWRTVFDFLMHEKKPRIKTGEKSPYEHPPSVDPGGLMRLPLHDLDETKRLLADAAIVDDNVIVFAVVLRRGLKLNMNVSWYPFAAACSNNAVRILKFMLAQDNLTWRTPNNMSPFCFSIANGHLEVIEMLMQSNKFDVNLPHENPPLIQAVRNGQPEIVRLLLNHSQIDINAVDMYGMTALHYCSIVDRPDIAEILLLHPSIDVNQLNRRGWTVFQMARIMKRKELIDVLNEWRRNTHPSAFRKFFRKLNIRLPTRLKI